MSVESPVNEDGKSTLELLTDLRRLTVQTLERVNHDPALKEYPYLLKSFRENGHFLRDLISSLQEACIQKDQASCDDPGVKRRERFGIDRFGREIAT